MTESPEVPVEAAPAASGQTQSHAEPSQPVPAGEPASDVPALNPNMSLLLDVELEATLRFGSHDMSLRDIIGMTPGTVVELDQLANEPVELLVAGRLIARGEVVVVEGHFGLQVSEVASARQRAEVLQE